MSKIYLDSYVFIDILSGKKESKKAAQHLKSSAEKMVSAVLFSEISYTLSLADADAEDIFYIIDSIPNLHIIELDESSSILAGKLLAKYSSRLERKLTYFTAVHLATAIDKKCKKFVTSNESLKKIKEIKVEVY